MRLIHVGMDSLQVLAKQGLLEGATICNLKFGEHFVLDKETKVKFVTAITTREVFLIMFILIFVVLSRLHGLENFVSFVDDLSRHCWVYPMRQRFEVLDLFIN